MAPEQVHRGQGLEGGHVTAACHDHVGDRARVVRGEVPDADSPGAVHHGVVGGQPVVLGLFAGHDHVDVVAAAEAVIGHGQQAIGVRGEIDTDHRRLLVDDQVDETRVLMGEPVVVLTPHVARQQVGERRHGSPPRDVVGGLEPFGVLIEHGVHDVDERLVAIEQAVATRQEVPLEPALTKVLGEHLHDPAPGGEVVVAVDPLAVPGPVGDLEHVLESVRCRLVGAEEAEVRRIAPDHVPEETRRAPSSLRAGSSRGASTATA